MNKEEFHIRADKLSILIDKYHALTPMGKALCGMSIIDKIDQLMLPEDNIIKEGNCCTYRQLISDLLFLFDND